MSVTDRPKRGQAENALQEMVRLLKTFEAENYKTEAGERVRLIVEADGSGQLVAEVDDCEVCEQGGVPICATYVGIYSFDSTKELVTFLKASPGRRLLMLGSSCGLPF